MHASVANIQRYISPPSPCCCVFFGVETNKNLLPMKIVFLRGGGDDGERQSVASFSSKMSVAQNLWHVDAL